MSTIELYAPDRIVPANLNENSLSFPYILRRLTATRLAMAREERRSRPNAVLVEGLRREYFWWEALCEREMQKEESQ